MQASSSRAPSGVWQRMIARVTAEQWNGVGLGDRQSNLMIACADLRVGGGAPVKVEGTYVSNALLAGTLGFSSMPLGVVHVAVPAVARSHMPRAMNGGYNPADFVIPDSALNNVEVTGRYWKGKAMPPWAIDPVVRRMSSGLRQNLLAKGHDALSVNRIREGDYFFDSFIRRCTEVQFLEAAAAALKCPEMEEGSVNRISGTLDIVSRFPPCRTNCEDLIREVTQRWPHVQVNIATIDGRLHGTLRPRRWEVPAPIVVPVAPKARARQDAQPVPNAWATPLPITAASTRLSDPDARTPLRFTFNPGAADFVPRSSGQHSALISSTLAVEESREAT